MKPTFKTLLLAGCISILACDAHAAVSLNDKVVVRSNNGNIVRARLSGTCTRIEWKAGNDVCAAVPPAPPEPKQMVRYIPPAPQPYVVSQRQEVLNSEEKIAYFDFNSARLTPEAQMKLDSVAEKLSAASNVQSASIVGYADRIGSNSYNIKLSEKRAHAVQDYLTGRGYLNTQVAKVRGLGESQPVTNCDKSLPREEQIGCLSADRRVELEVNYTKTQVNNTLVQPVAAPATNSDGYLLYRSTAPNSY